MPQPDLREATSAPEPLLPIEKKLIGWSRDKPAQRVSADKRT